MVGIAIGTDVIDRLNQTTPTMAGSECSGLDGEDMTGAVCILTHSVSFSSKLLLSFVILVMAAGPGHHCRRQRQPEGPVDAVQCGWLLSIGWLVGAFMLRQGRGR